MGGSKNRSHAYFSGAKMPLLGTYFFFLLGWAMDGPGTAGTSPPKDASPTATKAELAILEGWSMPGPLTLGGRPRPRLTAGGCAATAELPRSTKVLLVIPARIVACKQRRLDNSEPTKTNYYQKGQNQIWICTDAKLTGRKSTYCVPLFAIKRQLNNLTRPECGGHLM